MILMVASRKLSDREYHDTKTEKEFSTALKMTFACLVNTGGVVLFINAKPKEWYKKGGLIDDLFYVLMVDALVPPLIFFIDVKYYLTWFLKRRKLTESTMQSWNDIIRSTGSKPKNAEQAQELKAVKTQVDRWKKSFEPSEMDNM